MQGLTDRGVKRDHLVHTGEVHDSQDRWQGADKGESAALGDQSVVGTQQGVDAGGVHEGHGVRSATTTGWIDRRDSEPDDLAELLDAASNTDRPTENPHV